MNNKIIFFVRHGESEANNGLFRHTAMTSLTDKGILQSQIIAEHCYHLNLQKMISSSLKRGRQTASIIADKINLSVEYSDLFVERKRPSEIVGKLKTDVSVKDIDNLMNESFIKKDFRFSDEENFEDLKKRALNSLLFLKDQPYERILVVTHGVFLRIVLAAIIMGDSLTANTCLQFISSVAMDNTALTIIKYRKDNYTHPWLLWSWNDCSHLLV